MFFTKKAPASPLLSIQAAQFAGLQQALALLKRIRVTSTPEERNSFTCGESFRLLDFYAIKLVEVLAFGHIDDQARGDFIFLTPRLLAQVEISLEREKTTLTKRSADGFQEKTELDRWKPIQGSVWVREGSKEGYSCLVDRSATSIRDAGLESLEDLPLTPALHEI